MDDKTKRWIKQFIDKIQEKRKRLYSNGEEQSIHGNHTFSFSFKLPATRSFPVLLPCFLSRANKSPLQISKTSSLPKKESSPAKCSSSLQPNFPLKNQQPPQITTLAARPCNRNATLTLPAESLSHTLLPACTNALQDSITGVPFPLLLNSTTWFFDHQPRGNTWPYGIVTLGKTGCMKVSL